MKPVTPQEVFDSPDALPPRVLEVWNDLLRRNRKSGRIVIKQDSAVMALVAAMSVDREEVFNSGWLEVEGVFGAVGWKVTYEKPGWNEPGEAFFTFEVAR